MVNAFDTEEILKNPRVGQCLKIMFYQLKFPGALRVYDGRLYYCYNYSISGFWSYGELMKIPLGLFLEEAMSPALDTLNGWD